MASSRYLDTTRDTISDTTDHRGSLATLPLMENGNESTLSATDDEFQPLLKRRLVEKTEARKRKIGMILGVTIPCILSIFSVILFLRLGMILGQAGYLQTLAMLIIGYAVVILTVLSISAIATNGSVEGGGVYFMISRALGPEFGGSIGVIFVIANLFGSATYLIGFTEALIGNLGNGGLLLLGYCNETCENSYEDIIECCPGIPGGRWLQFTYASALLLFCLIICLIGAGLFAKTTFIIFVAVMFSIITALISFSTVIGPQNISLPPDNPLSNITNLTFAYTGFNFTTFVANLRGNYTIDYSQPDNPNPLNFETVFAILFNGCTGIMAGANISGDLKNPSVAIPQGTLLACGITFCIYIILFTFSAFTCEQGLLINNYNYLQAINLEPAFITIGVFSATLSAALATLIGGSRILYALAKDRLFSGILHPFTWTLGKKRKEPIISVLFCWIFVQLTLIIGNLNIIAPIVTMFFLLSYGIVNLACFALKFASAPNFRPTFEFYSRYTSILGALSCFVLMFVINPLYAALTLVIMILLFIFLLIRAPATPWGDVSQALIYHQVRKFLLRLDIRKTHIKFWRPEILLMVSNPRSSFRMINFCNDLKKGGLYVLGHVVVSPFNPEVAEYYNNQLKTWLDFIEISKFKAFVELSLSDSVRAGTRNLLTSAGLGGMKPNILALGFYSPEIPQSCMGDLRVKLNKRWKAVRVLIRDVSLDKYDVINRNLPPLRTSDDNHNLRPEDYVAMIQDAVMMRKNVCILRHFENFTPKSAGIKHNYYIDVWPLCVRFNEEFDDTFTLMMQLACVLHMKDTWKTSTHVRIYIISDGHSDGVMEKIVMNDFLEEARIEASVDIIPYPGRKGDEDSSDKFNTFTDSLTAGIRQGRGREYFEMMNDLMKEYSYNAYVIFTALPKIPDDLQASGAYIDELTILTNNLPPTVLVNGCMSVITNSI